MIRLYNVLREFLYLSGANELSKPKEAKLNVPEEPKLDTPEAVSEEVDPNVGLNKALDSAVNSEDYEVAAKLRDRIKIIEEAK